MKSKGLRGLLLIVLIAGSTLALIYRDSFDTAQLEVSLGQTGTMGVVLFILIYAIGTVLFLPGSLFTLAAGALFGPLWGVVYGLGAATLGATLAFLIARYLGAEWVQRHARGRLKQIKEGVEEEGWRFVAFTRLVPLFPFNLLNYALGLTRIKLSHYVITSSICMLPGAIAYTYLGYAGREALVGGEELAQKSLLALALLASVALLPRLIKRLDRKALGTVTGGQR